MSCARAPDPGVTFNDLPLWRGLEAEPGQIRTAPFSLGCTPEGWIRQTSPPEVLAAVLAGYGDDHYAFLTKPPGHSSWADSLGERNIAEVAAICGDHRPRSVLEVGGGSLYVARRLTDLLRPDHYTLVDPAVRDLSSGTIEVVRDYFPCDRLNGSLHDLIVSFNCLEHVPDPKAFLAAVKTHLAPDGMAVMIAPDIQRQFETGDLNGILHEHLSYFTVPSLVRMAASIGLDCSSSSRADQFVCVLRHNDAATVPAGTDAELLARAGRLFTTVIETAGTDMRANLAESGRLAFHGATNGLNNFLWLAGLAGDERVHVYDGDEAKRGLYLPTCVNPIGWAGDDPNYVAEPVIWVSAMTFFEPIAAAAQGRGIARSRLRLLGAR